MFDPLGQYYKVPAIRDSFSVVVHTPSELKAYLRENFRKDFRVLYVPLKGDIMAHWSQVGTLCYAAGNMMICIDEVGFLCEGGKLTPDVPKTGQPPVLFAILHFGRHRNIQVVATSQLPTDVALRYRSLCTDIRMFKIDEPTHLAYLGEKVGGRTVERLPSLEKYDYVVWTDNGEVFQSRTERS